MEHLFSSALKADPPPRDSSEAEKNLWALQFMVKQTGAYMSYWYGGLFTVCEGWQDLGLSDPEVDELLKDPNLQLLKRYRNRAFHYQADYFDPRFTDFQAQKLSVHWVRKLNAALGKWFLEWARTKNDSAK